MKLRNLLLLGGLAIVVGAMLVYSLQGLSTFTDFRSARGLQGEAHILGTWVDREKSHYDPGSDEFFFYMQDSTHFTQLVRFDDPKPINLDQAEKVYIIGKYDGEVFHAQKILMKCPSKYEKKTIGNAEPAQATR